MIRTQVTRVSEDAPVGGTVPATLALTLAGPVSFGAFTPGVAREYSAFTTANVVSTAGDAALTITDPASVATGHLVNGTFALPRPLAGLGTVKTWSAPTSNEAVAVEFKQADRRERRPAHRHLQQGADLHAQHHHPVGATFNHPQGGLTPLRVAGGLPERVVPGAMGRGGGIVKRTLKAFYDDQMTHHAAALTYYALMSLFPAVLLSLSLLGLVGQYPQTYDALLNYLSDVVPESLIEPLDSSLRSAFQAKGTATTTLVISVGLALYGTTGVLEAARRALNVVFDVSNGRSFLRRKLVDAGSTVLLMVLILVCLVLAFIGGGLAEDLLGYLGLGEGVSRIWNHAALAGGRAGRDARVLLRLLRHAGRAAPGVPLDHARRGRRRAALARGVLRRSRCTCRGSRTSGRSTARSRARSCWSAGSG